MCILTYSHVASLSHGRVQPIISTQPFTANGDGDFFDPIIFTDCVCADKVSIPKPKSTRRSTRTFNHCTWHKCCVVWYNRTPCSWFLNFLHSRGDGDRLRHPGELEHVCPDRMSVNEYVTRPGDELPQFSLPVFPSVDMFYVEGLTEEAGSEHSDELDEARYLTSESGYHLWRARAELAGAAKAAYAFLEELEADFVNRGVVEDEGWGHETAFDHFQMLLQCEEDVRRRYNEFLATLRWALELAGRLPSPEKSYVSPDGSFCISAEQLGECDLDVSVQRTVWNGPLKQSGQFEECYFQLKELMDTVKLGLILSMSHFDRSLSFVRYGF